MNELQAQRLADRLNHEEPDKIRWSYVPRHSAIEGAWYVGKIDCHRGERLIERIYSSDVEPVTRCPKCGITVFQSSDSATEYCSAHAGGR